MNNVENPVTNDPLVDLILELARTKQHRVLTEIRSLIYQPIQFRYHPTLFSLLPEPEHAVTYYSLRQAYRLVGPLMAGYPVTTDKGNFGRSLGELERTLGQTVVERKLLIIRQAVKLPWAEPTLLHLVTLMQRKDIAINWNQFVNDARYWNEKILNRWYEGLISVRQRKEKVK